MSAEPQAAARAWIEPGAFSVAPGVHRIPLPLPTDGLRAVNVYAIEDGDSLVLIDGGWALAESREALVRALRALGCGLPDIRRFLVTHVHRDHYTQAIELRREFGSRVSLGIGEKGAVDLILGGGTRPLQPQLALLRVCGAGPLLEQLRAWAGDRPPRDAHAWEAPDEWLESSQEIELKSRALRVLATPGHTRGHVVFADREAGLLFAGDHVLPHITPSIGFEPLPSRQPLADYLGSLQLLKTLPDLRLLPAHGPVADSVHARVDELLAHHDDRLDRSAAAVGPEPSTAYEVAGRLRWTRRGRELADLDPFNQMLAVIETRAHLELLAAQGRLTVQQDGEAARYSPGQPEGSGGAPPGGDTG